MNTGEAVVQKEVGESAAWIYERPRQRGKMHLLTIGCISVTGVWSGELGQYYLAWAPLLKRDKAKEREILETVRRTKRETRRDAEVV